MAGFPGQGASDQRDPRLNDLFTALKTSEAVEAVAAERKIWAIWLETPDRKIRELLDVGIIHMNGGANAEALKSFDEIVALAPDFAEGWNKRATVHYLLGNFDASLADIEKTLALEPRHFGALSGRGLIYSKLEDLEKALTAFEAALDIHPNM
ncbi:MAG: tetratricopeptide repeat protein, partial [Hyphomicrobiaceae bacterium]|nr:tetratricopeptide repeat protein [Hyphomicrobiaceae bacterium]